MILVAARKRTGDAAPPARDAVGAARRALCEPLALAWMDAHVLGLRMLERVTLSYSDDPDTSRVPRVDMDSLEPETAQALYAVRRDWTALLGRGVEVLTRPGAGEAAPNAGEPAAGRAREEVYRSVNALILDWTASLSRGIEALNTVDGRDSSLESFRSCDDDDRALDRLSMSYIEAQRWALKAFVEAARGALEPPAGG